ncbi:MAG: hypothetical protein ACRD3O_13120 [Terriglobia bacterium]
MTATNKTLESLLPLLQPDGSELHLNAAIVEVAEPAQLAELAADPRIRRYLLARLSDTVALVDPGHAADVERALLDAGHTPKVLTGDLE